VTTASAEPFAVGLDRRCCSSGTEGDNREDGAKGGTHHHHGVPVYDRECGVQMPVLERALNIATVRLTMVDGSVPLVGAVDGAPTTPTTMNAIVCVLPLCVCFDDAASPQCTGFFQFWVAAVRWHALGIVLFLVYAARRLCPLKVAARWV